MRQGLGVKAVSGAKSGQGFEKGLAQDAAAGLGVVAAVHGLGGRMGGHQIKDGGRGRIEAHAPASAPLCTAHMPA